MANEFSGLSPVVFNESTPTYRRHPISGTGAAQSQLPAPMFFDHERPLLNELGINPRLIMQKALSILHPLRSADPSLHADADLSGPFVFILSFGLFQLLAGKFHFVLGSVIVASLFLYYVFSKLSSERHGDLDFYKCVSFVGYGMLPMVIFSAVSLFLPRGGGLIFWVGMGFVLWSTRVCTSLLASSDDEHRTHIACACCLVYMFFSLLVIF